MIKRIIPCLDVSEGKVVKGVSFGKFRDVGDPVELGSFYSDEGADELVFLDITASIEARDIMVDVVKRVAKAIFIPFIVGGGLKNIEDMRRILEAGASKVSINTAAVHNPQLISEGARQFGSQCIVVAIDAKRLETNNPHLISLRSRGELGLNSSSKWEVYIYGGREPTGIDAVKWAKEAAKLGAGELLVTSIDRDGHQMGYDLELTRAIAEETGVPVIASGGAGKLEHLYKAIVIGKADAVLAASIFHYGKYSIREAKLYLAQRGIPVRL